MRRTREIFGVGLLAIVLLGAVVVPLARVRASADVAAPKLRISEINISGDEFIVLENVGTAAAPLANYWLGYVGSDVATAVPSQQLAAQSLAAGDALVLNNGAVASCGAADIDALSFALSNTAGTVDLWQMNGSGGSASFAFINGVSWGKAATGPSYLHITDETNVAKHNATNPNATWFKADDVNGQAQNWQLGDLQDCSFTPITSATSNVPAQVVTWDDNGDTPPFTVGATVAVAGDSAATGPSIPAADIGLKAVQLSEIMPNPASPLTDTDDEFIELYNPNAASFDLSGFKLQIGSTTSATLHSYTFPSGTVIAPKELKAFMSSETHLALSNSGGQVWLVDPIGTTMGQSDTYGTAKDGYAWILAAGKWQWTTQSTPNKVNVLAVPIATGSTASKKTATINGRKVSALTTAGTGSSSSGGTSAAAADAAAVTPIHPWTLALVVGAALLYGAYEYRQDLANRLYQLRSYRAARRQTRG